MTVIGALSSITESLGGVASTGATPSTRAASAAAPAVGAASGSSFADVLGQMVASGVDAVKAGEAAAISGMQGKMSTQHVVEAVLSAEQSLQIAIALRDKVIGAYQEVARMTI